MQDKENNFMDASHLHNDEISFKELILIIKEWWLYFCTKWLVLLFAGIIGGALGLTYAIFKKPIYTAETTFVLEEGEQNGFGLGQYEGLASMVGIDLARGGGIFKGDNILELYKSRKMISETLLSKDTFKNKEQLLIDRYIEFNQLRESWEKTPFLANINFSNTSKFNRLQDSIINDLVETINKNILKVSKPDKKLSIISVKVESKDELFAKSFADNIVKKVNQFYVNTKTKKSIENVSILERQADSVRRVLNTSIGGVAAAIDANPNLNPAFQTLRVGSQKKQVDVQASGAIYQELVKNLELSKITLRKESPLIQVIDNPIFPLKVEKLGRIKGIIFGGIILGFLTIMFLFCKKLSKHILSN